MLVEDLIKQLQQFDPKLPVILNGYEGGFYNPSTVNQMKIALDVHPKEEWWYGPHEHIYSYEVEESPGKYNIVNAVYLG